MRRKAKLSEQKEKGREFGKISFLRIKLWRVPKEENLVRLVRAQLRPKSVYLSAFFIFTQKFLFFTHRSLWVKQAVCKTVAVYALEVQILPGAIQ